MRKATAARCLLQPSWLLPIAARARAAGALNTTAACSRCFDAQAHGDTHAAHCCMLQASKAKQRLCCAMLHSAAACAKKRTLAQAKAGSGTVSRRLHTAAAAWKKRKLTSTSQDMDGSETAP